MFLYDEQLQLHINTCPLLISSKVQKAAKKVGVTLTWNEDGFIHQLSFDEVKRLSAELGIVMLCVREYMLLVRKYPQLASPDFAEWLDDTYTLSQSGKMIDSSGIELQVPTSRPGWFDLDHVGDDGLPKLISSAPGDSKWKFWTQSDSSFTAAAVRSFVTSSGTCSIDLGIPSFAKHPNFMIRECYRSKPRCEENGLDVVWKDYEAKTLKRNDQEILDFFKNLDIGSISQVPSYVDNLLSEKYHEMIVDMTGKKRLLEQDFSELQSISLKKFISTLDFKADEETTYVLGHSHPDADAIVGALFEAVRRTIFYKKKHCVWAERVPNVVRHILGEQICDILSKTPKLEPIHDVVLVDCYDIGKDGHDFQVKSVVDHHIITRKFPHYLSISQEVSWSSTVQIYLKFLGSGLDLDGETAKILLEATLVEAEPSLMQKMSNIDQLVLERLKSLAKGSKDYPELMSLLTRDTMKGDSFMMDYKQGLFGFSVIKTQQITSYAKRAKDNNIQHHLPLTVVKQVVYDTTFSMITKETISMYFNCNFYDKGFKKAVIDVTQRACEALHGKKHITSNAHEVIISNVSHQTPRLLLAPLLEIIVKEHLRFFRSKSIGMYVACGFYSEESGPYASPGKEPSPKTGISYREVKDMLSVAKGVSFMSLPQYWQVYQECKALNDKNSLKSLRSSKYVELLDTVIFKHTEVINSGRKAGCQTILPAKPALIRPEDINLKSGFPDRLVSPDTYSDHGLWRYWSPDRDENVATRGHIFVMDQTCIDLKIGLEERTKQLTFRPIYKDIPELKYELKPTETGNWVQLAVYPRTFAVKMDRSYSPNRTSKLMNRLPTQILGIKLSHQTNCN